MDFGLALKELKKGNKVSRVGWNGKGMFVFLDPGYTCIGYKNYTNKRENIVNPHFIIKNVNNTLSTWVPSVNDCLSEDWQVVD